MHVELFPVEFVNNGGYYVPRDENLHRLAEEYSKCELQDPQPLSYYRMVWLVCRVMGDEIVEPIGIVGYGLKADISLIRVSKPELATKAFRKIFDRLNGHFADTGFRGQDVMVYLSADEKPEQKCHDWAKALETYQARPAHRYLIKCK